MDQPSRDGRKDPIVKCRRHYHNPKFAEVRLCAPYHSRRVADEDWIVEHEFRVGDRVYIEGERRHGVIVEVDGENLRVRLEDLPKVTVRMSVSHCRFPDVLPDVEVEIAERGWDTLVASVDGRVIATAENQVSPVDLFRYWFIRPVTRLPGVGEQRRTKAQAREALRLVALQVLARS